MIAPSFIGIGAPKAATSWLTGLLDSHPGLYLTPIKETHFFDYPYQEENYADYLQHFSACQEDQLAGEFSTDYFASSEAPQRIKHHLPGVKLLLSLRNPVDQIYSNYWHALRQGFNCIDDSIPSFDEALVSHYDHLLRPALFGSHLERWWQHFDPDQMHIIFYDDVKENPLEMAQALWRFLDVPVPASTTLPEHNTKSRQGVSLKSERGGKIYNRIYFTLNSWVLRPIASAFGHSAATKVITALRLRQIAERLFFKPGYPPMSSEQRHKVQALLHDDIRLLEKLTQRDLSHWQ
jgi:hypothetical protein